MRVIPTPDILATGSLLNTDLMEVELLPMDQSDKIKYGARGLVFPKTELHKYPTLWPVSLRSAPFKKISSPFGHRHRHSNEGNAVGRPHRGIDIGVPRGSKVLASGDGFIFYKGYSDSLGNWMVVAHPQDVVSIYCHLASPSTLPEKSPVKRGQIIAYSGNSGRDFDGAVFDPHLHFEIRISRVKGMYQIPKQGMAVDPMPWLVEGYWI